MKKILIPLSSLALCSIVLFSCTPAISVEQQSLPEIINLPSETLPEPTLISVSEQAGGKISLKFNANPKTTPGFKTQANCTVASHLQSFQIYLIDGSISFGSVPPFSPGSLDGSIAAGPFNINNAIVSNGGSQTIALNNVNTGLYYLAVAAYDGPNGTGANITASTSIVSSLGNIGGNPVAVTDGGGESGNPGRVDIGAVGINFPIQSSSEATLTMTLELDTTCI